jgi:predicted dehydrogenase
MGKLYKKGEIGELEYAECEYVHNCEDIWPSIAYGDKNHWRNNMFSTFYCTHSLGPIIHGTGLRPVKVVGFEATKNERSARMGKKSADFGIEMVTLENGALVKSIHGGLYNNSIWYTMYGTKGSVESGRELSAGSGGVQKVYISSDENVGDYKPTYRHYEPDHGMKDRVDGFGHGGSDFYSMYNFVEKLRGDENADTIDEYEAVDMSMAGMFAFRSILAGGAAMDIPNLREKAEREKWRNDTACCDPNVAGDMLLPTCKGGTPDIEDEVYEFVKHRWEEECASDNPNNYRAMIFKKGEGK